MQLLNLIALASVAIAAVIPSATADQAGVLYPRANSRYPAFLYNSNGTAIQMCSAVSSIKGTTSANKPLIQDCETITNSHKIIPGWHYIDALSAAVLPVATYRTCTLAFVPRANPYESGHFTDEPGSIDVQKIIATAVYKHGNRNTGLVGAEGVVSCRRNLRMIDGPAESPVKWMLIHS